MVLALFWGVFVNLPQLLLNSSSRDYARDINATLTSLPIAASQAPALVYFGGYQPAYYKEVRVRVRVTLTASSTAVSSQQVGHVPPTTARLSPSPSP